MKPPQRRALFVVSSSLVALSALPIGLGLLAEAARALVWLPLLALALLWIAAVRSYRGRSLSRGLAFALVAAGLAVVHAAAGFASLELTRDPTPMPEAFWLFKHVCTDKAGALILLCPVALALDFVLMFAYALMYVSHAFSWTLRHVGAPALFVEAAAWLIASAFAFSRRARSER